MIVTEIAQPRTIAERLASNGIPIADALRYAMLLAEALRGIHDTGPGVRNPVPGIHRADRIGTGVAARAAAHIGRDAVHGP